MAGVWAGPATGGREKRGEGRGRRAGHPRVAQTCPAHTIWGCVFVTARHSGLPGYTPLLTRFCSVYVLKSSNPYVYMYVFCNVLQRVERGRGPSMCPLIHRLYYSSIKRRIRRRRKILYSKTSVVGIESLLVVVGRCHQVEPTPFPMPVSNSWLSLGWSLVHTWCPNPGRPHIGLCSHGSPPPSGIQP